MNTFNTNTMPVSSSQSTPALQTADFIRAQVLRGIALNREPGYHFSGNFLDLSFDHVDPECAELSVDVAPHCADHSGQLSMGGLAILADLAMSGVIRAGLEPFTRLATVTMNLQFSGVPRVGRVIARGAMHGFVQDVNGRQGMSTVSILGDAGVVCQGSATFMVLPPPKGVTLYPVPHRKRGQSPTPEIPKGRLTADEKKLVARAEQALTQSATEGGAFVDWFWGVQAKPIRGGVRSLVQNGMHIGNRVGHVQGGIMLSLAALNAIAALSDQWALTAISAWFISPGEGRVLKVTSKIVHQGRLVAVVRTEVIGKSGRKVFEVVTTHASKRNK